MGCDTNKKTKHHRALRATSVLTLRINAERMRNESDCEKLCMGWDHMSMKDSGTMGVTGGQAECQGLAEVTGLITRQSQLLLA